VATSKQEAQWVLRAQCHDREALELLLRSVQPALHRYLARLVSASSADDVLQEVLIILCRKLTWLEAPELFRPWAYRIASRAAFRHLKKERNWSSQLRDEVVLEEVEAPEPSPSAELLPELLSSDALSPASRAVLALHFQEELSCIRFHYRGARGQRNIGSQRARAGHGNHLRNVHGWSLHLWNHALHLAYDQTSFKGD
jgi:RNA polymerase sigma-70 factor (ECF subfamily)